MKRGLREHIKIIIIIIIRVMLTSVPRALVKKSKKERTKSFM